MTYRYNVQDTWFNCHISKASTISTFNYHFKCACKSHYNSPDTIVIHLGEQDLANTTNGAKIGDFEAGVRHVLDVISEQQPGCRIVVVGVRVCAIESCVERGTEPCPRCQLNTIAETLAWAYDLGSFVPRCNLNQDDGTIGDYLLDMLEDYIVM